MPAHVRAALTAVNLSIPVIKARWRWAMRQGIYPWEHRKHRHYRAGSRRICGIGE